MTPTCRSLAILIASALIVGACSSEPELEVEVAESSPSSEASAQGARLAEIDPPAADGELPPGHPPIPGQEPAGGGELPAGHPPLEDTPMALPPVDPAQGTGEQGLAWDAPESWVPVPPSSSMRRAQYRVPGEGGDAELAVFYFGPGQGGDPMANAQRWASQFVQPDGGDPIAAMTTERFEVNGRDVLLVETTGTYQVGPMMGGTGEPMPGYMLLGAIAEGPDASWFFKLTGPEATVEAQRDAFRSMLGSLRRAG